MGQLALFVGGPLHAMLRAVPDGLNAYHAFERNLDQERDEITWIDCVYERRTFWREMDGVSYSREAWVWSELSGLFFEETLHHAIACQWFMDGTRITKTES